MFTLPSNASDDELRDAVHRWFTLIGSSAITEAAEFLDYSKPANAMSVHDYMNRIAEITAGGKPSIPAPIERDIPIDELPIDGPVNIVCRWIPGSRATADNPGFIAEILHTIPVDGTWTEIDASFYVRLCDERLSLQLRDLIQYPDN